MSPVWILVIMVLNSTTGESEAPKGQDIRVKKPGDMNLIDDEPVQEADLSELMVKYAVDQLSLLKIGKWKVYEIDTQKIISPYCYLNISTARSTLTSEEIPEESQEVVMTIWANNSADFTTVQAIEEITYEIDMFTKITLTTDVEVGAYAETKGEASVEGDLTFAKFEGKAEQKSKLSATFNFHKEVSESFGKQKTFTLRTEIQVPERTKVYGEWHVIKKETKLKFEGTILARGNFCAYYAKIKRGWFRDETTEDDVEFGDERQWAIYPILNLVDGFGSRSPLFQLRDGVAFNVTGDLTNVDNVTAKFESQVFPYDLDNSD